MALPDAPKGQRSEAFLDVSFPGLPEWMGGNWEFWANDMERVPELKWPRSAQTYETMRTDSQVDSLWQGTTLGIQRYRWFINPNGASEAMVQACHEDFGLPVLDQEQLDIPRSRDRFSWNDHLRLALLSKVFGHSFFEQVGEIRDNLWRLQKLAYIPPRTIKDIKAADSGGLIWIAQQARTFDQSVPNGLRKLPVSRLVAYVNQREGANWVGRSMFRSIYKNWLSKDRLLRLDLIKHERNSLGIPGIKLPDRASTQQIAAAQQIASALKSGEYSGLTLPGGMELDLHGVKGSTSNPLDSIRYHDEQMARKFLQMFAQLGTTSYGSRALSESFIDYFSLSQMALAEDIRDTFNQHVIEDYVDWNEGPDAKCPIIQFDRNEDPDLATADLVAAVDKGILTVDLETENWLRRRWNLPKIDEAEREEIKEAEKPPAPVAPSTDTPPTPNKAQRDARQAHREPVHGSFRAPAGAWRVAKPHEVTAAADFDGMQTEWKTFQTSLLQDWAGIRAEQVESLADQIKSGADAASLYAPRIGADELIDAGMGMANAGIQAATAELVAQGRELTAVTDTEASLIVSRQATLVQEMMATGLEQAAMTRMSRAATGDLAADALDVVKYLDDLSPAWLEDQLGGYLTAAQNTGRALVFERAEAESGAGLVYYASEIMDTNTCKNCRQIDGSQYATIGDARQAYPLGGYKNCKGGARCRGTLVAVVQQ
jgi:hypothetical protein